MSEGSESNAGRQGFGPKTGEQREPVCAVHLRATRYGGQPSRLANRSSRASFASVSEG